MTGPEAANYFVYLSDNRLCTGLGCTTLSTGFTHIAPGLPYPPVRHPDDHHYVWQRGRVLQAYQFALVSAGRGRLHTGPDREKSQPITAGDILILLPGVWHRFAPDPATGWTENWIECRGPAFDAIRDMGLLSPDRPLWRSTAAEAAIFAEIHTLARENAFARQAEISALGLRLLARYCESQRPPDAGHGALVERARQILTQRNAAPPPLPALAAELGVSYPALRRIFRAATGQSLKAFHSEIRLRRARELLRNTDKSVKEIAGLLGYSSAFHFSASFQQETGDPPSRWRAAAARD